ncbi:MAG: hypothetical protein PWQ82_1837 [Thermosediminibacterales bacterium]|nr:hypothetical protein [Thermosediminibacterales bacterium]
MILTNIDDYLKLITRYYELLTELLKIEEEIKNFELIYVDSCEEEKNAG